MRILHFVLAIAATTVTLVAVGPGPVVRVNGKPVQFAGTQPQTVSGRLLVPMRAIFEAIGAYVEYNPVLQRVVARKDNEVIELRAGDRVARTNGAEIELDVAPTSLHGRMMVPLRFIAESLGADVAYSKSTNTVDIVTDSDLPGGGQPPPAR
jgi:hypothetical protein